MWVETPVVLLENLIRWCQNNKKNLEICGSKWSDVQLSKSNPFHEAKIWDLDAKCDWIHRNRPDVVKWEAQTEMKYWQYGRVLFVRALPLPGDLPEWGHKHLWYHVKKIMSLECLTGGKEPPPTKAYLLLL